MFEWGIFFALVALLSWGLGDFLIQRSTRKLGDWESLFAITFVGAIVLTPFVWEEIKLMLTFTDASFWILLGISVIMFTASLINFESLKRGKIAVVEPIFALEVPVVAVLAFGVINENLTLDQAMLIGALLIGIILISLRAHHFSKKAWIEKGVLLAIVSALFMGAATFLMAYGARAVTPLMTIWFTDLFMGIACLLYLTYKKEARKLFSDMKKYIALESSMIFFDNLAWISYAIAVKTIPIAIAVALSESYIALAVLLGLLINKEKLSTHQKVGLTIAIVSAIALAYVTG